MALKNLSETTKFSKVLVVVGVAAPILLGTGWIAKQVRSAQAGSHVTGKVYLGTVKYLKDARIRTAPFIKTDRVAVVKASDGREIYVHNLGGRFDDCESNDEIRYLMKESGVQGVEFFYVEQSCRPRE